MQEYSPNVERDVHDGASHHNNPTLKVNLESLTTIDRLSNEGDPKDFADEEGCYDNIQLSFYHHVFEEVKPSTKEGSKALFCHVSSLPSTPDSDCISSRTRQHVLRQNVSVVSVWSMFSALSRISKQQC